MFILKSFQVLLQDCRSPNLQQSHQTIVKGSENKDKIRPCTNHVRQPYQPQMIRKLEKYRSVVIQHCNLVHWKGSTRRLQLTRTSGKLTPGLCSSASRLQTGRFIHRTHSLIWLYMYFVSDLKPGCLESNVLELCFSGRAIYKCIWLDIGYHHWQICVIQYTMESTKRDYIQLRWNDGETSIAPT